MSIAVVSLGSLGDAADRSAYTCPISRQPGDNALVLVTVNVGDTVGTPVEPTSVVGAGLVFSLVTSSLTYDPVTVGSQIHNLSIWRSMALFPDGSLITATFPNTAIGCGILVLEVSGVSTSGTSGANAVGKSLATMSGSSTGQLCTGPSATSTANAWYSVWGRGTSSLNGTPNVNYVAIDDVGFSTPSTGLQSAWTTLSSGNTMQWTSATAGQNAALLVELVADNPAIVAAATPIPVDRRPRLPEVPSQITGILGTYLRQAVRQLNAEGFISLFSGADPNTSGFTGVPGNMLVNIGSASTWTRLWLQAGGITSTSTISWHPVRMA